jgi:hypothetical protein
MWSASQGGTARLRDIETLKPRRRTPYRPSGMRDECGVQSLLQAHRHRIPADKTARVWQIFGGTQDLAPQAKADAPRCQSPTRRKVFSSLLGCPPA